MSGEVKSLLKEAREAVGSGRAGEARALCERALAIDPHNYMAHVLSGVALQADPRATRAFRAAILIDPQKLLAWQGLASYYEKLETDEAESELVSVYTDMLGLDLEPAKIQELLNKLSALAQGSHVTRVAEALARAAEASADPASARAHLATLLASPAALRCAPGVAVSLIERLLPRAVQNNNLLLNYARLISVDSDICSVVKRVMQLEGFLTNPPVQEWVCRRLFEEYTEQDILKDIDLQIVMDKLSCDLVPTSVTLLRCVSLAQTNRHREAYELAINLLNPDSLDDHLVYFLVKRSVALYDWSAAENLIVSTSNQVKNLVIFHELKRRLLLCETRLERWERGLRAGAALQAARPHLSPHDANLFATCLIRTRATVPDDLLARIHNTEYHDSLIALQYLENDEPARAKEVLEKSSADTAERWLYLGVALRRLGGGRESLLPLLKATRLDPGRSACFLQLGLHYEEHIGDLEKAKKCYLRAMTLNRYCGETARALCNVHRELGDEEAAGAVLRNAATSERGAQAWARRQLGLHELAAGRWDAAVRALRAEVRASPRDRVAWSALGDAYFGRRSFASALKCYTRAVDLASDEALYERSQTANINYTMGLEDEAVKEYERVLDVDAEYRPALEGIADTLEAIARDLLSRQMYAASRERAQEAMEMCARAVAVAPQHCRPWKSLGDKLLLLTKYPPEHAYVHVPAQLVGSSNGESLYKMKHDIFPLAIACYSRAAKVTPYDPTPLHRDVAATYLAYYETSGEPDHHRRALAVARHCVNAAPAEWEYWNLLGVIAARGDLDDTSFAQYCFLKALSLNRARPEAWSNLGALYLARGEYRTANRTFQRAQEDDPDFVCSWIGQALIAEAVRPAEAMDLFRHAAQLAYHEQAAIGYANYVCATLRDSCPESPEYKYAIDNVHAVSVALDLMSRVCVYRPRHARNAALLGLLQESSGLLQSALASYEIATRTSETREDRDAAALHVGRAKLRLGDAPGAVRALHDVAEATFGSASCTALALYRARDLADAYDAFDAVLQWLARDDAEKCDALVAMACVAREVKGVDEAKTILFRSIKASSPPSAHSLLATCALGVLHADAPLARLALDELRRHKHDARHALDAALLTSRLLHREDRRAEALAALRAAAERCGGREAWTSVARLSLLPPSDVELACACADRALGGASGRDARTLSLASVVRSARGEARAACALAQSAVRADPEAAEAWAALVLSGATQARRPAWLSRAVERARARQATPSVSAWFDGVERACFT